MTTRLSLYGQLAYSNCHLFIPAPECGFTRATERHSPVTFPRPPYTRTGYHSEALPRMPFSALKSVYDGTGGGLDPNFADSLSGSIIGRCESTRRKLRGLCTSRSSLGRGIRRTACEGRYLGWSIGSATLSRPLPFYTGHIGVLNQLAGASAAMISVIGKRWRACAVRLCIKDH
jgi:hypothetical protein